jgi:hypothetical protein
VAVLLVVFVRAPAPFGCLLLLVFLCCFLFGLFWFAWEDTHILPGDVHFVPTPVVGLGCHQLPIVQLSEDESSSVFPDLFKFRCMDRAFELNRPDSEEKKYGGSRTTLVSSSVCW